MRSKMRRWRLLNAIALTSLAWLPALQAQHVPVVEKELSSGTMNQQSRRVGWRMWAVPMSDRE